MYFYKQFDVNSSNDQVHTNVTERKQLLVSPATIWYAKFNYAYQIAWIN